MTEACIVQLIDDLTRAVNDFAFVGDPKMRVDVQQCIEPIVRDALTREREQLDACLAQVHANVREASALVSQLADALTAKKAPAVSD